MAQQQRLSATTEAWRRRRVLAFHHAGWTGRASAEALGVVPSAVSTWRRQARDGGADALRTRRQHTGTRPKLTSAQQQRLLALLTSRAEEHGASGERWTGTRVAALIKREVGSVSHPEYIPRLLRSRGWTPQQPSTMARQRDEAKIEQFKAEWDAGNKGRSGRGGPVSGELRPVVPCCPRW